MHPFIHPSIRPSINQSIEPPSPLPPHKKNIRETEEETDEDSDVQLTEEQIKNLPKRGKPSDVTRNSRSSTFPALQELFDKANSTTGGKTDKKRGRPPLVGAADPDSMRGAAASEDEEGGSDAAAAAGKGDVERQDETTIGAVKENMDIDLYYDDHAHEHPPDSVLDQFDKDPRALQVRCCNDGVSISSSSSPSPSPSSSSSSSSSPSPRPSPPPPPPSSSTIIQPISISIIIRSFTHPLIQPSNITSTNRA